MIKIHPSVIFMVMFLIVAFVLCTFVLSILGIKGPLYLASMFLFGWTLGAVMRKKK